MEIGLDFFNFIEEKKLLIYSTTESFRNCKRSTVKNYYLFSQKMYLTILLKLVFIFSVVFEKINVNLKKLHVTDPLCSNLCYLKHSCTS